MKNFNLKLLFTMTFAFIFMLAAPLMPQVSAEGVLDFLKSAKILGDPKGVHLEKLEETREDVLKVANILTTYKDLLSFMHPSKGYIATEDEAFLALGRNSADGKFTESEDIGKRFQFKICKGTDVVGYLQLSSESLFDGISSFDVSYFVSKSFQKRNAATEALSIVCNELPKSEDVCLTFEVHGENQASLRVLEKVEDAVKQIPSLYCNSIKLTLPLHRKINFFWYSLLVYSKIPSIPLNEVNNDILETLGPPNKYFVQQQRGNGPIERYPISNYEKLSEETKQLLNKESNQLNIFWVMSYKNKSLDLKRNGKPFPGSYSSQS